MGIDLDDSYNATVSENVTILQRRLTGLKDAVNLHNMSKGKASFMLVYLDIIDEYITKSLDLLDNDKYREALKELDDL
jgi:hypothetical protein